MFLSTFTIVKSLCADLGLPSSDVQYLCRRINSEGTKFLTSTLPRLWKCVCWSFNIGYFDRSNEACSLTSFAWKGRSLRYFRSLLDRIFDWKTGKLLDAPCATAVFNLRMLCEYLYKLVLPFTQETIDKAEGSYKDFELNYPESNSGQAAHQLEEMRWALTRFYPEVCNVSVEKVLREHWPRYGPGSMLIPAKYGGDRWSYWEYKFLPIRSVGLAPEGNSYKGISGFFKPYPNYKLGPKDQLWRPEVKRLCEVIFVPKNADGPRVISRENPWNIRLSMAYFDWASSLFSKVTDGRVQFRDQSVNRELARIGSVDGSWSCFDMKEASDRVSYKNACRVFQNSPAAMWFFRNARATHALLPSGAEIPLRKLAGMGSGLTFPTMAMFIYLASIVSIIRDMNPDIKHIKHVPGISKLWRSIAKQVYVFGDDVVVNSAFAKSAVAGLERVGMLVNNKKSHFAGPFRESCGGDYLGGIDVTPIRLKLMSSKNELNNCVGSHGIIVNHDLQNGYLVERHCRELVKKGLVTLSDYYYRVLEKVYGELPYVSGESPYLGRYVVGGIPPSTSCKAWYPIPRIETFEHMDQQTALGRSLRTKPGVLLYSTDPVALNGELAVPRAVKLRRRLVTMLELNGDAQAAIDLRSAKYFAKGESIAIKKATDATLLAYGLTTVGMPDWLATVLAYAVV